MQMVKKYRRLVSGVYGVASRRSQNRLKVEIDDLSTGDIQD